MKPSRFNVSTIHPSTGDTLLFNTLTGAFCGLGVDTSARARRALTPGFAVATDPEIADYLAERGFLVPDEQDEEAAVLERSRLGINDPNRLDVIVMPNMNCNLACVYCYESHHKSNMQQETADQLIQWLEQMVPRFKVFLLSWFGGEPLLSYPTVVRVQKHARDLCAMHGVSFSSHMTTNGFALSEPRAAELVSLGLSGYQITLDGVSEIHDAMRPLRGGGSSFQTILSNVLNLVEAHPSVRLSLRINYNETNLDKVPELLRLIPEPVRPQIDVVLERIFGERFSNFVDQMPLRVAGTTTERLYRIAAELGFSASAATLGSDRLTYCYADRQSMFLFNYNGDVFKCTVDTFESKDRLGVLGSGGVIQWEGERLQTWHAVEVFEEKCHACAFMPMCMGGCRKVRSREGTVGDDCQLPFAGFDLRLQHRYSRELGESRAEDVVAPRKSRRVIPLVSVG